MAADPSGIRQAGDGTLVANTGTICGDLTVISGPGGFRLGDYPPEDDVAVAGAQPSSLSALLRAASQIVPFTGRANELTRLRSWRDSADQLSVMLISGPAGQGKTRLAWKFASDSARDGWAVLQARHGSDPQPPTSPGASSRLEAADVLVVVDYAERGPRQDLQRLMQHRLLSEAGKARVLLLARPAGYWWKALANPLAKLGASTAELPLGPLAETVAERNLAFTEARDRFAAILGVGGASRLHAAGSLTDDAYQLALTLHMAALIAVDAHRRNTAVPDDPGRLSLYLVDREYDHWHSMRDNKRISVSPPTMARLAALATLTQSLPHPAALELLVTVGLAGSRADAQALLDDHASCYPVTSGPDRVLEPLRPDRLGEDFLADLMPACTPGATRGDTWMATIPSQLLAAPAGTFPGCAPAALTVLVETGRRWEHVRQRYLRPVLLGQPDLALTGSGAALVTLAGYADVELLAAIGTVLPRQRHVELDSGIAALTMRLTDYGLTQAADDTERAKLHDNVADRFSNAGLYSEALSATSKATAIRRGLAGVDPARHQPALANSLGNLGIDLWNIGRSAEALDAMTEAVAIYRGLAESEPAAYQEDLAAELNNLAGSLLAVERYDEALAPAIQAMTIFRQRAEAGSGLRHELGTCLRNLSVILSKLGRPQEALTAAQEAAETYRQLAQDQPETYEVELAESLRSLSNRLSRLQQHEKALIAAEEGVSIARRLAAANPAAQRQNLALTLQSLAARLWNSGQRERSLAVSEETLSLHWDLVKDNPRAHSRGLGVVLNSYASHLLDVSRPHEALQAAKEAIEIWRRLAAAAQADVTAQLDSAIATRDRARSALSG
jgi:tetratricopeptide (TPR) repeat protein